MSGNLYPAFRLARSRCMRLSIFSPCSANHACMDSARFSIVMDLSSDARDIAAEMRGFSLASVFCSNQAHEHIINLRIDILVTDRVVLESLTRYCPRRCMLSGSHSRTGRAQGTAAPCPTNAERQKPQDELRGIPLYDYRPSAGVNSLNVVEHQNSDQDSTRAQHRDGFFTPPQRARNDPKQWRAKAEEKRCTCISRNAGLAESKQDLGQNDVEYGREQHHETNPLAATMCQSKRRLNAELLEEQHGELLAANAYAKRQERALRNELTRLRTATLNHTPAVPDCNCTGLHIYNARKAQDLALGWSQMDDSTSSPSHRSNPSTVISPATFPHSQRPFSESSITTHMDSQPSIVRTYS